MEGMTGHLPVTGFLNVPELETQSLLFNFLILSQMQDTWGQNLFMTSCEFLGEICPNSRVNWAAKERLKGGEEGKKGCGQRGREGVKGR